MEKRMGILKKSLGNKGQIWVETVIYTLIGLALIGLVLAIVTPRINEFRDRAVIEQTINSLNVVDSKINEVLSAPGNVRVVEFSMGQGNLYIDTLENNIEYIFEDSRALFSEPDIEISIGRIDVLTTEGSKRHKISLRLDVQHNLTFEGAVLEEPKKFTSTRVPYKFAIRNTGNAGTPGEFNIDIGVLS